MSAATISPIPTPDTPVAELAQFLGIGSVAEWPKDWHQWENIKDAYRRMANDFVAVTAVDSPTGHGRGIVMAAGGVKYFPSAWITINRVRQLGCRLPIQLWYLGDQEMDPAMKRLLAPLGVMFCDAIRYAQFHPHRRLAGWELKLYAVSHSPFAEVLFLDADCAPLADPTFLFDCEPYRRHGSIFWPDFATWILRDDQWQTFGLSTPSSTVRPLTSEQVGDTFGKPIPQGCAVPIETGQFLIDKGRCRRQLQLASWYCEHSEFTFWHGHGDKDMILMAWSKFGTPCVTPRQWPNWHVHSYLHYDFGGHPIFVHRTHDKWRLAAGNVLSTLLPDQQLHHDLLDDLRNRWGGRLWHNDRPTPAEAELARALEQRRFLYRRIGYDERPLDLLADGQVGAGSNMHERHWSLYFVEGDAVLALSGASTPTCLLRRDPDGVWRGRWLHHEKMLVELEAIPGKAVPVKADSDTWWQHQSADYLCRFLRVNGEGTENVTRQWLKDNLHGKVLDCGCGAGVDYETFGPQCDYTGMDRTPKMLDICRAKFPEGKWAFGSIEDIPFPDQSFDIVYCRHVLEHLSDYRKAIDEMKRVGKRVIIVLFRRIGQVQTVELGHGTYDNGYGTDLLGYVGAHQLIDFGSQQIVVWENQTVPAVARGPVRVGFACPWLIMGGGERWLLSLLKNFDSSRIAVTGVALSNWSQEDPLLCREVSRYTDIMAGRIRDHGEHEHHVVKRLGETSDMAMEAVCLQADVVISYLSWVDPVLEAHRQKGMRLIALSHVSVPGHCDRMTGFASRYVTVARAGIQSFHPSVRDRVEVIYNGADVERTVPVLGRDRTRRQWGYGPEDRLIGFLGRLDDNKNPLHIARACQHLDPNYHLVIVGPSAGHDGIVQALPGRHRFVNRVDAVGDALAAFDVLINLSSSECFCLAITEAWLAGVPVVATPVGAIPELESCHGPLVCRAPAEPDGALTSQAIARALGPDNAETIHRARKVAWDSFTAPAMVQRWTEYLEELVIKAPAHRPGDPAKSS